MLRGDVVPGRNDHFLGFREQRESVSVALVARVFRRQSGLDGRGQTDVSRTFDGCGRSNYSRFSFQNGQNTGQAGQGGQVPGVLHDPRVVVRGQQCEGAERDVERIGSRGVPV